MMKMTRRAASRRWSSESVESRIHDQETPLFGTQTIRLLSLCEKCACMNQWLVWMEFGSYMFVMAPPKIMFECV